MVDRQFSEPSLAALYDAQFGREARDDFRFYLPLVMAAEAVLDVGCGTGALLHWARESGHSGRLTGLDPAAGMLDIARTRADIEWVHGDLGSVASDGEFELVVMTGHAFQVLVEDEQIRASLASVYSALAPGGLFGFETRNPAARAWERWTPEHGAEFVDDVGNRVRRAVQVETPVGGDVVRFTATYSSPGWTRPETSHSTLRFLGADQLQEFLGDAGFVVEEQFGDWDRSPLVDESSEIITLARRP
ncbi:MAG: class I SAM-dependent methyltransferase [Dehalococcoidia bacterium]|nr:class I SAM-dependent methyltransferase [Dehalococcoidia bacterium]MYK26484.1 class I SAM-dependent methyltransferase [Dehalococcoidia bacterium]